MLTNFLLIFGIVMIISSLFSYKQTKATIDIYGEMKRKGNLVVGQKRFILIFISGVVAFSVGKDNVIKDAVKINGMLPFQKIKTEVLSGYIGKKFTRNMNPRAENVDLATVKIVANMIARYAR